MNAAIALNNMGVTLLRNGHSNQALRVFNGVTGMLQKPSSDEAALFLHEEIKQVVHETGPAHIRGTIEVRPLEDSNANAKYEAAMYGSYSQVVFPIRMDGSEGFNKAYVTAVLLYNTGLACRCSFANRQHHKDLLMNAEQSIQSANFLIRRTMKYDYNNESSHYDLFLALVRDALDQIAQDRATCMDRCQYQQHGPQIRQRQSQTSPKSFYRQVQTFASAA